MKTIPLTQGQFAVVDDADYEALSQHKWCAEKKGRTYYAVRGRKRNERQSGRGNIKMHMVIAGTPPGHDTDHVDGNGLNNQRRNLRVVSHAHNLHNTTRKQHGCTSRFRGISWSARERRWRAAVQVDGRRIELGYFKCEFEAAAAYDAAGIANFGEHFTPNFSASWMAPCWRST
jgi:hypothetical protein